MVMVATPGTFARRGATCKRERLTFIAPAPVPLTTRWNRRVHGDAIVTASGMVMQSTGSTITKTGVAGKGYRLTLFTPLPVVLQARAENIRVHEQCAKHSRAKQSDRSTDRRSVRTPTTILLDPAMTAAVGLRIPPHRRRLHVRPLC